MNKKDQEKLREWCDENWKLNEENLKSSSTYCGLFAKGALGDPQMALSLGMALMLNKPIILLVDKTTSLPKRLKELAEHVEYFDPKDDKSLEKATIEMTKKAREIIDRKRAEQEIS